MSKVFTITIVGDKGYKHTAPYIGATFEMAYAQANGWLKQMRSHIYETLRIKSITEENY